MPNWCENILRLEHSSKSKLEEALQAFKDEKLLEWFVPMPDHIKLGGVSGYEMLSEDNWYGWRCKNWGTKWDIVEVGYKWISDHCLELSFDTAWDPPISAYDAAVAIHGFKLVAFYNEPNMAFCGEYVPNEKSLHLNYDDEIPTNLDEIFGIKERERQSEQEAWEYEQGERENEKTPGLKLQ
jgi:hypothetical protein